MILLARIVEAGVGQFSVQHQARVGWNGEFGMQAIGEHRVNTELRELVAEASLALARLDGDRLEELVLSCRALNRDLAGRTGDERADLQRQTHDASREMAVFGRVLEATRSNLDVLNRLPERKLMAFRLASEVNSPETRTAMRSGPASTVPLGTSAFCACSACISAFGSSPSAATCWVENSR